MLVCSKVKSVKKLQKLSKPAGNSYEVFVYLSIMYLWTPNFLHISANPFEIKRQRSPSRCAVAPSARWRLNQSKITLEDVLLRERQKKLNFGKNMQSFGKGGMPNWKRVVTEVRLEMSKIRQKTKILDFARSRGPHGWLCCEVLIPPRSTVLYSQFAIIRGAEIFFAKLYFWSWFPFSRSGHSETSGTKKMQWFLHTFVPF